MTKLKKKNILIGRTLLFCSLIEYCVDIGITRILHRSEWQIVPAYFEVKMRIRYANAYMLAGLHWWQMESPGDAFLDLDSAIYLVGNGSHKPPGFIQNILNCVLKTNKLLLVWNGMG